MIFIPTEFRDLIDSQGYEHVNNVFPRSEDFSASLLQTRARIATLNAQSEDPKLPYVSCLRYGEYKQSMTILDRIEIEHHTTYSSVPKDKVCFLAFLTSADVKTIELTDALSLPFLLPLPDRLKFDSSVVAAMHWLHSGSQIYDRKVRSNRNLAKNSLKSPDISIINADVQTCPIFSKSNTHASRNSASKPNNMFKTGFSFCHPISHTIVKKQALELSVVLHSSLSMDDIAVEFKQWLAALNILSLDDQSVPPHATLRNVHDIRISALHDERNVFELHGNAIASNVTLDRKGNSKGKRRSKYYRQSEISHALANTRHIRFPNYATTYDVDSSNFMDHGRTINSETGQEDLQFFLETQEERRAYIKSMWTSLQDKFDNLHSSPGYVDLATTCKWDKLTLVPPSIGKNNIAIKLHRELLKTNSDVSAMCFALLVSTISESHNVIRVAVTRPIRLENDFARATTQSGAITNNVNANEPFSNLHLNGSGEVVGLSDSGLDEYR